MTTLEEAQARVRARIGQTEPLEFRKLSAYSIVCKCCGQFYVCKYGTGQGEKYEVWFKPKDGAIQSAIQLRTNLPTPVDAKNWASSIAAAYRKGHVALKAPSTREEIERQRQEIERLRQSA